MLWREFMEGTACKDTPYNYQVYKDLEILYMNSDKTHAEIYEYGKKLVDNSLTQKELDMIEQYKQRIKRHQETLEDYKKELESYKMLCMADMVKYCRRRIAVEKDIIRNLKSSLRSIR